jgi:hypothetical protein
VVFILSSNQSVGKSILSCATTATIKKKVRTFGLSKHLRVPRKLERYNHNSRRLESLNVSMCSSLHQRRYRNSSPIYRRSASKPAHRSDKTSSQTETNHVRRRIRRCHSNTHKRSTGHKSANENPKVFESTVITQSKRGLTLLIMDPDLVHFTLNTHLTPQGLVDILRHRRKP